MKKRISAVFSLPGLEKPHSPQEDQGTYSQQPPQGRPAGISGLRQEDSPQRKLVLGNVTVLPGLRIPYLHICDGHSVFQDGDSIRTVWGVGIRQFGPLRIRQGLCGRIRTGLRRGLDRKSTRLNSSHMA